MGEIQSALSGQEEFTAHRWHGVKEVDCHALSGGRFGRHQARGPPANDGNLSGTGL